MTQVSPWKRAGWAIVWVAAKPRGNVLSNDSDVDSIGNGETKAVVGVVAGASASASGSVGATVTGQYGSIAIASNGSYTFNVDNSNTAVQALRTSSQTLSEVFTYTLEDAAGATSTATLTITIQGNNDNPTAVADNGSAVESGGIANGTLGSNAVGNVLTNDTDVDTVGNGETKTVIGVASGVSASDVSGSINATVTGTYGSLVLQADGSYVYTIDENDPSVQALRINGQTLTDVFTYTQTDAGGLTSTTQLTITIHGRNDNPVGLDDNATAVESSGYTNATAGSNPTGNVLTNDTDADSSINGETKNVSGIVAGAAGNATGNIGSIVTGTYGSLTMQANGSYAYSVNNSNAAVQALRTAADTLQDRFTYSVVDASGATSLATLTVTIEGRNDAPIDMTAPALAANENATNGLAIGTLVTSDLDSSDTFTYQLTDDAGGRFSIDSATGILRVADGSLIDREFALTHNVTVQVTDAGGLTFAKTFTIAVNDVNEFNVTAPVDNDGTTNAVSENASIGSLVGITASATDADDTNNTVTYSLFDSDGGNFTIDANTGVVTTAAMLNREASGPSRNITIRATSSDGSHSDQTFTIAINDVNEFSISPVTDSVSSANSVVENATIGTAVGITAFASDADATTNAIAYSMTDSDGGRFAVDPTTGIVTVAGAIDRETDGLSRIVTIRGTSADGSYSEQSFLINIYDADEFNVGTISDLDNNANVVAENSAVGTVVHYQAFATDLDATNNGISYSLDDSAGGRFAIDAATGIVTVAGGAGLDYETNSSHTIVVRATSVDGSYSVQSVGIAVLDVNEKPLVSGDSYSTSFIDVLRVLGAGVGFNDFDPEGTSLGFQLISGPSHGVLTFASDGTFEYTPESGFTGQVTFEYRAFDGALYSDPTTVTIDILMPVVGAPGGSGGSGSSGSGSSGSSGSGSTDPGAGATPSGSTTTAADPSAPPAAGLIDSATPSTTAMVGIDIAQNNGADRITDKDASAFGIIADVDGRGVGELAASNSQRTLRVQFDQWASGRRTELNQERNGSEEFVLHSTSLSDANRRENNNDDSRGAMSFTIGTAVSTAIGTGAILWVVQATQLAATFISAAAPTWMQVDIASALNNLAKEKSASDEASAKIFE